MGLFSKDDALVKEIAKKEKQKKKQSKTESKAMPQGAKLNAWLIQPLVLVVVLATGLFVALEFAFVRQAEQQQASDVTQVMGSVLVRQTKSFITEREQLVSTLASSSLVVSALQNPSEVAALESTLKGMFSDLDAVFVLSMEDMQQLRARYPVLTFANIDAVRQAAEGKETRLDAFLNGQQWLVQSAAPIRAEEDGSQPGVVLVVHNTNMLKKVFALPSSLSGGAVKLTNSPDKAAKAILSVGSGSVTNFQDFRVPGSDWVVSFSPGNSIQGLDRVMLAISVAGFAIVMMLVIFLLGRRAVSSIRQDLIVATQAVRTAIEKEGKKSGQLYYSEIKAMVGSLTSCAKEQARNQARQNIESKAAPAKTVQEDSPSQSDAPLFEDDLLDLDVLNDADEQDAGSRNGDQGVESAMVEELAELDLDVSQSIFRAYDIRGVVDDTLTEGVVELIGKAFASEALAQGQTKVCVGYDGRLSSRSYCEALTTGIVAAGADAIIVGQVPTPVLYFATHHLQTGTGVMITGSHNPSNYNGFKMMIAGNTLANEDIQKLYNRIVTQDFAAGQGQRSEQPVDRDYMDTILNDIAVAAPLKVVVDAGNGVAGELGPALIEELGCEVIPLFCEIDGNFPNHHPDPGKPKNLQDLIAAVEEHQADVGLAFDGDGDRVGVVTNSGKIIWPDRLLMLFAKDVVSRNPGADVIFDVKCSRRLNGLISGYGGRPIMWKTGHSLIKAKMKETGALLAGEMSGHIFFKERWLGFDDGLYSAARLLEILGVEDATVDVVFETFPEDVSTPEINIDVSDENKFLLIEKLCQLKGNFADGNVSTIDGLRVDYPNGWGLCRASNTTPVLVLRFEADDEQALEEIKDKFKAQLAVVEPSLDLSF